MAKVIRLQTEIAAPVGRVFDLARSIDAHLASAEGTDERAVAGVTHGLIGLGGEVTWEARHFGIKQRLTVRITAFDRPWHFEDTMVSGTFKSMRHRHWFEESPGANDLPVTLMSDEFEFQSPCGILGRWVDHLILSAYMERFLRRRNAILKNLAESENWRKFLT